jgi:hypothetical protein
VTALVLSAVALWRTDLHQWRRGPSEVQRKALESVNGALAKVYSIVENADVDFPTSARISAAVVEFIGEWTRWQHQLPRGSEHIGLSIGTAMGNFFGSPATAWLDPRSATDPANAFDDHWWEISRSYVENVRAVLGGWLQGSHNREINIVHFHAWRRDEDAEYFFRGGNQRPI